MTTFFSHKQLPSLEQIVILFCAFLQFLPFYLNNKALVVWLFPPYHWIECTLKQNRKCFFHALHQVCIAAKATSNKGQVSISHCSCILYFMNDSVETRHRVAFPRAFLTHDSFTGLILLFKIIIQIRKLNRWSAVSRLLFVFAVLICNPETSC